MATYLDAVRQLPIPTEQQTHAFARFVTVAHSWYKSLRRFPGYPFAFILDPNAGRAFVSNEAGFKDYGQGPHFHYATLPTPEYRKRFGHWNYSRDSAVKIHSGGWLQVPPPLAAAGTAEVNFLMYGGEQEKLPVQEVMRIEGGFFSAFLCDVPRIGGDVQYFKRAEELEKHLDYYPEAIARAARPILALWASASYRSEWTEAGGELARLYKTIFSRPGTFDDLMKELGGKQIQEAANAAWERTESRRREIELLKALRPALDAERERQIDGMIAAMQRFVAALRASKA